MASLLFGPKNKHGLSILPAWIVRNIHGSERDGFIFIALNSFKFLRFCSAICGKRTK